MGMPLGKMSGYGAAQICSQDAGLSTIDELHKQFEGNSNAEISRIETTS
jgi:hypothetical protein